MLIANPKLKPLVCPERLSDEQMAEYTARLSIRQCATLTEMACCELHRRGFRRVDVGSRRYCLMESIVAADVRRLELDLDEIAAQIEEARWETA